MGRSQAFDTTTVVQAARDLFWDKGYDSVSLSDLERATGLNRSSMYNAFESKRGLFDAAVQDYLETVIRPRLQVLDAEPDGRTALITYFSGLGAAVVALKDGATQRGCLLVNSAAGLAGRDDALRAVVEQYRLELSAALARALSRPSIALTLPAVDIQARLLTSLSTSALLLARINPTEAVAILDSAIEQIESLGTVELAAQSA
ncbi:TetR/AcrR family transcriptional regulator [Leifsonia sp. YAF41]|uniref:TetR/AcrR family transcriptional regulator n=1 Tax=Leifsonia sp. YAF41 TaxID=3233086 RepID=UPI003F9A8E03